MSDVRTIFRKDKIRGVRDRWLSGADAETMTRIGDDPDYDARWIDICDDCVRRLTATLPPLRDKEER